KTPAVGSRTQRHDVTRAPSVSPGLCFRARMRRGMNRCGFESTAEMTRMRSRCEQPSYSLPRQERLGLPHFLPLDIGVLGEVYELAKILRALRSVAHRIGRACGMDARLRRRQ